MDIKAHYNIHPDNLLEIYSNTMKKRGIRTLTSSPSAFRGHKPKILRSDLMLHV